VAGTPVLGMIRRRVALLVLLAGAGPVAARAQVGLTSAPAQVALLARSSPRAAVSGVSAFRETGRTGTSTEGTVTVRLSVNTGYRLVVVGTDPEGNRARGSRVWVRADNGRFEEIGFGTRVTVLRGSRGTGQPQLRFRTERPDPGQASSVLPVRYELRIDPAI
jgi:hypothetical protein